MSFPGRRGESVEIAERAVIKHTMSSATAPFGRAIDKGGRVTPRCAAERGGEQPLLD